MGGPYPCGIFYVGTHACAFLVTEDMLRLCVACVYVSLCVWCVWEARTLAGFSFVSSEHVDILQLCVACVYVSLCVWCVWEARTLAGFLARSAKASRVETWMSFHICFNVIIVFALFMCIFFLSFHPRVRG